MAKEIILPKLGMDMTEGTIMEWYVEEGEQVNKGEPLLEVLTDKVSMEVEAEESGILLKKIGEVNEEYPVFTVIGYLGEEGESIPTDTEDVEENEPKTEEKEPEQVDVKPPLFERIPTPEIREERHTEIAEVDSLESIQLRREEIAGKVRATPAARRLAREHHIILENLVGSGPNGRIQIEDIEHVISKQPKEFKPKDVLETKNKETEEVIISTNLETIDGNSESNIEIEELKESQPKKDLVQRVPALAKIKSFVDDLDFTPRLDTRGVDGRVVPPGEGASKKRFKDKKREEEFNNNYGEYVKVLPKTSEEMLEGMITEMVLEPEEGSESAIDVEDVPEFEKGISTQKEKLDFTLFQEDVPAELEEEAEVISEESNKENSEQDLSLGKLSGKRKVIANRMVKSNLENAVITLTVEIDMTEVKELRKKITKKIEHEAHYRCTFTDFLLMATSRALLKHPILNSSLINNEIVEHPYVNMGLAVGLDDGLIVPVIQNTHEMSFVEMVKKRAETLKAVKNNYITQEDLKGSTFTITNLGMYGVLEFTAIINQPNSAILSVGEVVHRMRMHQGEPMMRSVMKVSLNMDHRITDGMVGAKFLQDVKADMENPSLLLF